MSVLEDPHHRAEGRGEGKDVERQRFQWHHDAAGQQEEQHEHDDGDQPEHHRQSRRNGVDAVPIDLGDAGEVDLRAARGGHRVQAVELSLGAVGEQRSCAVDGEKRAALCLSSGR